MDCGVCFLGVGWDGSTRGKHTSCAWTLEAAWEWTDDESPRWEDIAFQEIYMGNANIAMAEVTGDCHVALATAHSWLYPADDVDGSSFR